MTTQPTGRQRGRPPFPLLTPAEERVLKFIREGKTNAEIGVRLGVSPHAVKYHVSNMLGKLGLSTREELAGWKPGSGNPLGRLWAAIPFFGKLGIGAAAAVLAGGIAWSALSTSSAPKLYDGLVTIGYDGKPANGSSEMLQISANARYIVYASWASNLVPDDTNNATDVFRFDRETKKTELVSRGPTGGVWQGTSTQPSITADGRYVAYLAGNDPSSSPAGYTAAVRDMDTGKIVFTADEFSGPPAISGDGRYLATVRNDEPGVAYPRGTPQVWDIKTHTVAWATAVDREMDPYFFAQDFQFSPDGHWFVFSAGIVPESGCDPILLEGNINNVKREVPMERPFIHDMKTGKTTCAPLGDRPDTARRVYPAAVTDGAIAFAIERTEPNDAALIDSQVVVFKPETGVVLGFSQPGEPFQGTPDQPAVGAHGDSVAVMDAPASPPRGYIRGILWSMPFGAVPVRVAEQPSRFEQGFWHAEPSLSADGRTLAFAVVGHDRESGSQLSDIYVTSR